MRLPKCSLGDSGKLPSSSSSSNTPGIASSTLISIVGDGSGSGSVCGVRLLSGVTGCKDGSMLDIGIGRGRSGSGSSLSWMVIPPGGCRWADVSLGEKVPFCIG